MSHLVTIFSKFYDKSGQRIINLNVKSRYQGSSRENLQKTDEKGLFIFQASSNRTIEILAKPPNAKEYTVFKMMNSSVSSSTSHPVKVYLPKTIEEYRQENIKTPQSRTVKNLFKVIDRHGKVMSNFPIQSRPKGKKAFERSTNEEGLVEIESSPNRDIEILVLTSGDTFVLKKSINSGSGSKQPILIQLDEPYDNFKSLSTITLLDRNDNKYSVEKTHVEILDLESKEKNIITTSNGEILVRGHIGKCLKITVYKPDGTPLKSVNYLPKRIKESSVKLHLDVDVTDGSTAKNEPKIKKRINEDILITMDQMQKMWPNATVEEMQPILNELNRDLEGYKLDTRLRQAHFMAQVRQEVGPSFSLREKVEYMGPAALKQIGYYKTHPKQADIDGYKKGKGPANGEVIANRMYDDNYRGEKYKLGNISPGDGWKYLGRGLKQLTVKSNYQDLTNMYSTIWTDEKVDFVKNPELIEQPKYAVRSAIRFWLKYKLYDIADKGATGIQVDTITKVINEATDSYSARRTHFFKANTIFI
ncbi:glycoside hydrolase family 19 [Acinetobacter sp.]|uniref:glycoside hydrolase family 19 protein n=1 Tax=Acinetobacter sp. TaxID=472 RepID=UPI0026489FB8|nr:glycoside hydrolase family 19 [Acinetobacter sp.]MDN5524955.1 glycoside hydrolase family 19 [Acinetobacter sp.]MDN5543529.1 glycoside hydrolase family 19 [Acinetobacter sp.]